MALAENTGQATLRPQGVNQSDLIRLLNDVVSAINGITAKLDADGGVTDTNYAALWGLTATRISPTQ